MFTYPRFAKAWPIVIAVFVVGFVTFIVYFRSRLVVSDVPVTESFSTVQYLPLGDSYTIGEGLPLSENWPSQLAVRLRDSNIPVEIISQPAVTGYTTADLIREELPLLEQNIVDFVTIQIGVNDWVQKVDINEFRANLVNIVDRVQSQITDRRKVVLITIPDFSVVPQAEKYGGKVAIVKGISEFNNVIRQAAQDRDLPVVDIFLVSQRMGVDVTLLGTDRLHPSAKEYTRWVEEIFPVTLNLLRR